MKKSLPYEIIAAVLAILGAFLLVAIYMPLINPGLTRVETHKEPPSIGYYIILTPIALAVLSASWCFNRKAQRLKSEGNDGMKSEEKGGKLKWVLFGFVVLLVLYAFLW